MKRITVEPRRDWQAQVEKLGFVTHTSERGGYWNESACWVYTEAEMDELEDNTLALHRMCLMAVDHIVKTPDLMRRFGLPPHADASIIQSWRRRNPLGRGDPSLMGRMDLAFNGRNTKLIEYNADCPALLPETSIVQWDWLKQVFPKVAADERQFNIVHDYLVERFRELAPAIGGTLHFSGELGIVEENVQLEYMKEIAAEAGIANTVLIDQTNLGLVTAQGFRQPASLVDLDVKTIKFLYKMYPWEWMYREPIGQSMDALIDQVGFLEPPWKVLLSSKAILPVLWSLFPNHPLLLPAYFDYHPSLGGDYVVKPVVGWEGRGVELNRGGKIAQVVDPGPFREETRVYQKLVDMQVHPGQYTQTCVWMVGERAAAVIVREDDAPIITTLSTVVPHYWE